jgi:hypothetical protein
MIDHALFFRTIKQEHNGSLNNAFKKNQTSMLGTVKQVCDDRGELLRTNDQTMTNTNKQDIKKKLTFFMVLKNS